VSDTIVNNDNNRNAITVRPRNWLAPVALATLREQSCHGYELMERIARFGFKQINPGTLYRTLRKMEEQGLCETAWETSNSGPACRVYSVTDAGEGYLEDWAEECQKYRRVLDSFYLAYNSSSTAATAGGK
jgi:PadR family transcriptional regulator, regulatory protein PadR